MCQQNGYGQYDVLAEKWRNDEPETVTIEIHFSGCVYKSSAVNRRQESSESFFLEYDSEEGGDPLRGPAGKWETAGRNEERYRTSQPNRTVTTYYTTTGMCNYYTHVLAGRQVCVVSTHGRRMRGGLS